MSLHHVIMTRFNIRSGGREQQIRLQPGWLDRRFKLFEDYCLPGVRHQTVQAFRWIVLFDALTPAAARERIAHYQRTYPFEAEFTDSGSMTEIAPPLATRGADADWLLTSRLDSDDVLAADFVERLQRLCERREKRVINFDKGLILSIDGARHASYEHFDGCNPFAAYLEPLTETPKTIWGEMHRNLDRLGPIDHVAGAKAWMQVVHGGNVANAVRGRRVPMLADAMLFPGMHLERLGAYERPFEIGVENVTKRPARFASRIVHRVRARLAG